MDELKRQRLRFDMTQQDVAKKLGITRQAYSNYEAGLREPDYATLRALSQLFRCSADQLIGNEMEKCGTRVPILGTVKGGYDRLVQQEHEGYAMADVADADEYFYLRVTGDSMAPQIAAGDLALIHSQQAVDNGQIAVVLLQDDEATIKRVLFAGKNVILQPLNPAYAPMVLDGEECRILGRVVRTTREW